MGSKPLRLACIILLAAIFPAASRRDTFKQEMRFGVEAAQRGLWREAMFRWDKIIKDEPDNPHLHNNLAVALESLGQFDRARAEYTEARRLAPDSREIRNNLESFLDFCRLSKTCGAEPAAPGAGGAGGAPGAAGTAPQPSPSPDGTAPPPSPAPEGTPGDGG